MRPEHRVAILTQRGIIFNPEPPVNPVLDALTRLALEKSVSATPHLGTGIIFSEAKALGWEVDIYGLNEDNFNKVVKNDGMILLSAIDRGVDEIRDLLRSSPNIAHRIVIGGQGVTGAANELAAEFPDVTIVVGRAEGLVERILTDYSQQGETDRLYIGTHNLQTAGEEPYLDPRYSFRSRPEFLGFKIKPFELSTGCTQSCEMCPVARERVTYKPLDVAIKELSMMNLQRSDLLLFVDHNIFNVRSDYLLELFNYINQQGITWAGEGTIAQITGDEQLLIEMSRNCLSFLVGLEDISGNLIGSPAKNRLVRNFPEILTQVRRVKLPVTWSLIFPLDTHTPETYLQTAKFIWDHQLDVNAHLLQPRYGSELKERVTAENRWLDPDSRKRDGIHLVFEPKKMSWEEAMAGYVWFKGKTASLSWILQRGLNNLSTGGIRYAYPFAVIEILTDRLIAERMYRMYPELQPKIRWYKQAWQKMLSSSMTVARV